jgi:hypothetical protein
MKIRKDLITTSAVCILMTFFVMTSTACSVFNIVREHSPINTDTLKPMTWVSIKIAPDAKKNIPLELNQIVSVGIQEGIQEKLEKKVDEFLDGDAFPAGKLLFIESEVIDGKRIVNPTQNRVAITFSFAAENTPEFIPYGVFEVHLDNTDITSQIRYGENSGSNPHKAYQVFHVIYGPKGYLEPGKNHNFIITITDTKGNTLRKTVTFTIGGKAVNP